ncbi:crosslink repair DNA glycosylase YcaQ family protein [Galbitalea sp. SE-J8]|uniref:DNA glycosylase AlkZ-like family protein n=1 Tax=Galbitalea sp. SE-J8 TaxID=3054952 RepID=UPI00259C703B|nr:crosslink repair DNA glycosylase YcaQ family protein [Galbitalea sp. SE-J8]MDM4762137.1 crosslink repair DNA glycosylase YcaQ family protein [Galbitalea sp. SE-J8]
MSAPAEHLTLEEARRVAVLAQLLSAPRPDGLVETVDRLGAVRIDLTAAVAPSADLILYDRLGAAFEPDQLRRALDDRVLVELDGWVRPMDDLAIWLPELRAGSAYRGPRSWLAANAGFRRDVLDRIRAEGPLVATDIPDTSAVPWPSSGWTNDKNVVKMLDLLHTSGELAIAGRDGRTRRWDLAERVYPADLPAYSRDEAARMRNERRLAARGLARARDVDAPIGRDDMTSVGVAAHVTGLDGDWRVDPEALATVRAGAFEPRTVLLSPLDAFCSDRERMLRLFDFDYALEMYKPAAKRRWGYFALPILDGDRLVGKLDAAADRRRGTLTVNAVHEDAPFDDARRARVDAQIAALAAWLGLELLLP